MIVTDLASIDCTAVILAGGQARRYAGIDKGLLKFDQTTFAERISRIFPASWPRVIASHGNRGNYEALGFDCIEDFTEDYLGPMRILPLLAKQIDTTYIAVSACDTPFITSDVYQTLWQHFNGSAVYAEAAERKHYCCLLVSTAHLQAIDTEPKSMRDLLRMLNAGSVVINTADHTFLNVNSEQDMTLARRYFQEEHRPKQT